MKNYIAYDDEGKILQTGSCSEEDYPLQSGTGRHTIEGDARNDIHYISGGAVTNRPISPAILSGNVLSNLPAPCRILINGTPYWCTDTTATLTFTYSSTYKIVVEAFPYLDANFTVVT